ncbi:MAG: phospho-N-acetylmuramoyl-pentapeptide-transferase [Deltaproteobacteria bacterium]|nr:MAG: phospho-N-acetylmuramoyl-pentapeptide-transferase [Deltaproteobacteria bacterium]
MFYHLLYPLSENLAAFNIFRYITFRSLMAFLLATAISILWGKKFIAFMKLRQFGQVIREDGPESHYKKAGTPTMGGVFILGSIWISMLFFANFTSPPVLVSLFVMTSLFILGLIDDYLMVLKKNSKGFSAKGKLVWQFITAFAAMWYLVEFEVIDTNLYVPFVKGPVMDMGWTYLLLGSFVIVGSSNAVNLTDGLDGLAIGPILTSASSLAVIAYATGHSEISAYLFIPYVENAGELAVLAMAIIGAGVGFLWYNSYPAQIFMGDVGSLSLGGVLGIIAVLCKSEILFLLIGGIFVIETISVILQVGSYKLRKKRIFKMAPIHHHFELKGWPEPKVIVRFWIISVFLAILSVATLKIR